MSTSQSPIECTLHHASNCGDSILQTASIAYTPIDRFLMDQSRPNQSDNDPRNTPPQLNSVGNTQFVDFSFPFQNINSLSDTDVAVDTKIEHQSDIYDPSAEGSVSEHRSSITSTAGGRASFSSTGPLTQAQDGNVKGSDNASPQSNCPRRGSTADGFASKFELHRGAAGDGSDLSSKAKDEKDGPTPPWSELKTKAGKERKRLPLACIACRRKKIRCSGEKPACKHCLKSRIPCVYMVTVRKAAPRTDYMAMLDKRLKRMEERIIKIVPKGEHDPAAMTRAQVRPGIRGPITVYTVNSKKRIADETFDSELESWAKSTLNESSFGGLPSALLIQEAGENRLLREGSEAVPSREIQEHLAEVFFENVYGQAYHLLHKPSFMRKLRAGTIPPVLILSVCAVSSRFSTHPKLNSSPAFLRGEEWAAEARDIVMKRYDRPNITILTCLLLLGLHEFGTCCGGRSWSLGGMAIRMAYALQLHKDLDHDPLNTKSEVQLSFIDREIRRRIMWACFLMDRFNSSGTGRPMFTKEETIKVQLPIAEKYFQLDIEGPTEDLQGKVHRPVSPASGRLSNAKANMGVAAYMIRSIAIWGRIIMYLFQGGRGLESYNIWDPEAKFVDLEKQADGFSSSLPDSLKYTPDNLTTHDTEGISNQFLFLHISAQQNILFLNHFAIHGHRGGRLPKDTPTDFVTKTTAKAFEAAKRISQLLRVAESYSVTAPFAGYCAFLSSTVQVTAAFSKNNTTEAAAKKNLATNIRYLSKMKGYWGTFHWTLEHLKEQFRTCADAARRGLIDGTNQTPIPVHQYGDWFDRYPHGVSQSDFEDPAAVAKREKGEDAVLGQKSNCRTVEEFFSALPSGNPEEREVGRPAKRQIVKNQLAKCRVMMKNQPAPPLQVGTRRSSGTSIPPGPSLQVPNIHSQQIVPAYYNQISPADNVNIYGQPLYCGQDLLLPLSQQGIVPQLDRQLVFSAYAGMDQTPIGTPNMLETTVWDRGRDGATNFPIEPTSAWFMPFNMEPPEIGQDMGLFGSIGTAGVGYGVGGISMNQGNNRMSRTNGS